MTLKEVLFVSVGNNISTNNMTKKIKTNITFLQGFLKTAKPEVRNKINNLIDMYSSRKISNLTTVENMILKLKIADPRLSDANPLSVKKVNQKYDSYYLSMRA